ncbi:MAG TPA: NDP-sugar synthase [Thermoanaerobaculia bacterium]|jgi:NDP-sugar pyrophosphorylase family protein|nr:NDP-sugar synthase [Thermoanaerobaculia bacterium]
MLLAAGRGVRFRPVTESVPKPLFPYLNVPLVRTHLARLADAGVSEVGINLHHLGDAIEKYLAEQPGPAPAVRFFREPTILGTAGALANAADWLSDDDFLVVNADAAIEPDFGALIARHRESRRAATLLVTENSEPARFTPLGSERDRIVSFGGQPAWPLLHTGVCVLAPRLLGRIPDGERQLVADLWQPLLDEGREEIGWLLHEGPSSDLGTPRDFLRATRQALTRGGPFASSAGKFDPPTRVLSLARSRGFEAVSSVVGRASIGRGARLIESAVWDGVEIGAGAELRGCIAAAGRIPAGASHRDALLWGPEGGDAAAHPLN